MKSVLSVLFATLLFLTGCTSGSSSKKTAQKTPRVFRFNIQQEASSLDPRKVATIQDINVCRAFMDGLYRLDKKGALQPALAQSHTTSDDGLTYTFYLRDADWSDGSKITAYDFVHTWKSLLSPNFPAQSAYHLYGIKNAELVKKGALPSSMLGVQALDEKTLVVSLKSPINNFVSLTAHPVFFPVSQKVDKKNPKWAQSAENYVASGPFLPTEWKHHYTIVAEKNPKYWDAKVVQLDKLEMYMVSSDTEYKMYEANELDWAGSPISTLPPELIEQTMEQEDIHKAPFLGTRMVQINTTRNELSSPKIRRAFSLATDRKEIAEHVMHKLHDPAFGFVPECMKLHNDSLETAFPEDPTILLEEGLKEAGLTKESLAHLTLYYSMQDQNKKYAEVLQQQWREKLGIEVSLQALERKVFLDTMTQKQYDFILCTWIADVEDPSNFLEVFQSKEVQANRTGWEHSDYASLLTEAFSLRDPQKKRALLSASEKLLLEQAPIIPITHFSLLYKHKSNIRGIIVTPLGNIDFKWAHIDDEGAL